MRSGDEHGTDTCTTCGIHGDATGEEGSFTTIPARALEPVDVVEQGSDRAMARLLRVDGELLMLVVG